MPSFPADRPGWLSCIECHAWEATKEDWDRAAAAQAAWDREQERLLEEGRQRKQAEDERYKLERIKKGDWW
jgi:hypothetical protein